MTTTTRWTAAAVLVAALAGCAERSEEPEVRAETEDQPEAGVSAQDLAVWDVRFDDAASGPGGFQMTEAAGGWTIVTGANGAGVTWRLADQQEGGDFTVAATMEERQAPADHAEGYGLMVGGQNLQDPDQRYTYFLVRGTGHYLIKRRDGAETPTLRDWTASEAVRKVTAQNGSASNTLEIRAAQDTTRFFVNGTQVDALPTETVQPYGFTGLRVNHSLNVAVTDYRVNGTAIVPTGGATGQSGAAGGAAGATYPEGQAPTEIDSADAAR